jgi:Chlorophyll A-B binding protein
MMKLAVVASLVASATAFAPASQGKLSTALKSYENELGVVKPTGFFDPLGLSTNIDQATFDAWRSSEVYVRSVVCCVCDGRTGLDGKRAARISRFSHAAWSFLSLYLVSRRKHGRVCMLGVLGYVVPEIFRFPGEVAPGLKFADVPNGVAALSSIPALGWAQIFFLIGATDYYGFLGDFDIGKAAGMDAETLETRKMNELSNGRLAMLAFLELLRHDSQNYIKPGFDGLDNLIVSRRMLHCALAFHWTRTHTHDLFYATLLRLDFRSCTDSKRTNEIVSC